LIVGAAGILACTATPTSTPAAMQGKIFELTLVTSQPKSQFDNRVIPLLSELIEARSSGRIKIQFIGGPELVPPFQAMEYLKRQTMDIGYLTASYLAKSVPEFDSVYLGGLPSHFRKSGALELLNELLIEKHEVRNLGSLQGSSLVFISNEKIEKASFAGLKMRVSPGTSSEIARALGATMVTIPATEFYTALERGVVDGGRWPIVPIATWKLNEVAKYIILPPYLEGPSYVFLIREAVWQSLPTDLQTIMSDIISQLEDDFFFSTMGYQRAIIHQFESTGEMEAIVLPPAEAAKYKSVAEEAAWRVLKENSPEWGPRFESLLREK
jgi:TRAP-type transport system periplasmic protein